MGIDSIFHRGVFSIQATERLIVAARTMHGHGVGSLVVFEGEKLVGIITERDLARAMARGASPKHVTVFDYMTDRPITITPETGVREAAGEMLGLDVRHLPVVVGPQVVGMLSMRDLIETVVEPVTI
jgi:CBS domain-containing protein